MRVLLVAEGRHELGDGPEAGALETMVRRLMGDVDLEIERRRVSDSTLHAFHGIGQGYFKRAVRWLLQAAREGYDGLVLVIDHDGLDDRLRQIDSAQDSRQSDVARALGVAVRTFDAWMLADESAVSAVLGHTVPREAAPETIKHPKQRCTAMRDASASGLGLATMYAAIARQADLAVLEDRCPRGFAPFAARTRAMGAAPSSRQDVTR